MPSETLSQAFSGQMALFLTADQLFQPSEASKFPSASDSHFCKNVLPLSPEHSLKRLPGENLIGQVWVRVLLAPGGHREFHWLPSPGVVAVVKL